MAQWTQTPYKFKHYDISQCSLYVNGRCVPSEGLSVDMDFEKTSVMGYRTVFEGSGIHHSNTGLQITHDMHINGLFMLLFYLTPDHGASEAHKSLPENGYITIELQFSSPLFEAITCLLYLEYDSTVLIKSRPISNGHISDSVYSAWRNFIAGCLPLWFSTIITFYLENLHPHRQCWSPYRRRFTMANHASSTPLFECILFWFIFHRSSSTQNPSFIKRNCTTWEYNKRQLAAGVNAAAAEYKNSVIPSLTCLVQAGKL